MPNKASAACCMKWYAVCCLLLAGSRPEYRATDSKTSERRRQVLHAKTSLEAGKAFRAYFAKLSSDELQALTTDPHPSIALQASWEVLARAEAGIPPRPNRFLGFIEGRLQTKSPPRWEVSIITKSLADHPQARNALLRVYSRRYSFLKESKGSFYYHPEKYHKATLNLFVSDNTKVTQEVNFTVFTVGKSTVRVRRDVLLKQFQDMLGPKFIRVMIDRNQAFLACYEQTGNRFQLLCVDPKTGKVCWATTVWACGTEHIPSITGSWSHECELIADDQRILVFGVGSGGFYCEVFARLSGAPIARFASHYWYQEAPR